MSASRPSSLAPAPELTLEVVRPKFLPRRIHREPDSDIEELSSDEALVYKMRAKSRLHRLALELTSLRGKLSNRDLAEIWLGTREKEGTIRCWKNLRDTERYPRREDLERLEQIINSEREFRFGGALR